MWQLHDEAVEPVAEPFRCPEALESGEIDWQRLRSMLEQEMRHWP